MFSSFLCFLLSALKHSGNFRFEQIEKVFALLDDFHLLRGSPLLRVEPHAVGKEVSNSIESAVSSQPNSWSSLFSVATVLVACSASTSFT